MNDLFGKLFWTVVLAVVGTLVGLGVRAYMKEFSEWVTRRWYRSCLGLRHNRQEAKQFLDELEARLHDEWKAAQAEGKSSADYGLQRLVDTLRGVPGDVKETLLVSNWAFLALLVLLIPARILGPIKRRIKNLWLRRVLYVAVCVGFISLDMFGALMPITGPISVGELALAFIWVFDITMGPLALLFAAVFYLPTGSDNPLPRGPKRWFLLFEQNEEFIGRALHGNDYRPPAA